MIHMYTVDFKVLIIANLLILMVSLTLQMLYTQVQRERTKGVFEREMANYN